MISVQEKERAPKETAFRALRVKTQSFKNEIRLDPLSPYTFKFQRVDSQRLVPNVEYMYSEIWRKEILHSNLNKYVSQEEAENRKQCGTCFLEGVPSQRIDQPDEYPPNAENVPRCHVKS